MRKFTACVLSAGILMLTGLSDVEGLFGKKTANTDSVAYSMFGTDIEPLINAEDAFQAKLKGTETNLNKNISNLKKLETDVKAFDPKNNNVKVIMYVAERLENVATCFGTVAFVLVQESNGLKSIKKAKIAGNANVVAGSQGIRLAREIMKIMDGDLASTRANIALIGKMCKGNKKVGNSGNIKNILETMLADVTSAKKSLIALTETYAEENNKVANSAKDKEMSRLFKNGGRYIEALEEILNLYVRLLKALIIYAGEGDYSEVVKLARECEEHLSTGELALRSQIDRYEELDELEEKRKGNVKKKKKLLESNSTFRSDIGREAYEKSLAKSRNSSDSRDDDSDEYDNEYKKNHLDDSDE